MTKKKEELNISIFENCAEIVDNILTSKTNLNDGLELLECALIIETLNKVNGNNSQAAKILGINRTTFVMKVRRLSYLKEKIPNKLKVELV